MASLSPCLIDFDNIVRFAVFELFEIFGQFEMKLTKDFDGDWKVSLSLNSIVDVVGARSKDRFIFFKIVPLEHF